MSRESEGVEGGGGGGDGGSIGLGSPCEEGHRGGTRRKRRLRLRAGAGHDRCGRLTSVVPSVGEPGRPECHGELGMCVHGQRPVEGLADHLPHEWNL